MKNNEKKVFKDKKMHPGAYTVRHDMDNTLLDAVDSADDIFLDDDAKGGKRANPASPPAADPPVPNRAHTEM